ncbi:uncharacterized protein B0H18DRAFT_1121707 [Fomitopsis serialis]|uniref:uncharacterized protein n=1 Tax=Fomitopsis serialis TaxID=139415 RepID=UPI0020074689|nr:uncharacterized protein B0H18DRAFT_1121707 [Neoantrodia serialis]KAH9920745.1 hypothetical protein B0H18DRAFT_1121707 [Neoantrodia serialis]
MAWAVSCDLKLDRGMTGYCYGAPPAFYLAYSNTSHVTVASHPSRLQVPGDLESNPKVKAGKEGSFEAMIKLYKKHL